MGAYMYPIQIKREPQSRTVEKIVKLGYDSYLTLAKLKEYGVKKDSKFSVQKDENTSDYFLYIEDKRLETKAEVKKRVAREEAYMKNYTAFHEAKKV